MLASVGIDNLYKEIRLWLGLGLAVIVIAQPYPIPKTKQKPYHNHNSYLIYLIVLPNIYLISHYTWLCIIQCHDALNILQSD